MKLFEYTDLPYAVTFNVAVTFMARVLLPATLNLTVWLSLLYCMSTVWTVIVLLSRQVLKPFVLRIWSPRTLAGRVPRTSKKTKLVEDGHDLILKSETQVGTAKRPYS